MGYFISNIDNQIHNTNDIDNFIIIGDVINILNEDGEEIDCCVVYDTIGELMNATNSEQILLSIKEINTLIEDAGERQTGWSDSSYRIITFIGGDPTAGV